MAKTINWNTMAMLIVMFGLALYFWDSALLYPVKVFVVLLHEIGHGLAAEATGGSILRIEVNPDLGGVCHFTGGAALLVLPAGYLGSMFFGSLILLGASRTRFRKLLAMFLGAVVLMITVLYVRTLFGLLFGLLFGIAMILAGRVLPAEVNDILLKFLGLTSCLYAIVDIKEDLISRTVRGSDAYQMSEHFLLPPVFWGVLWISVAIVYSFVVIRLASRGK